MRLRLVARVLGGCACVVGIARAEKPADVVPTTVAAEPASASAPLEIDWQGPADCERGPAVQAKVLRLLGGSQLAPSVKIQVTVRVRQEKTARFVAELTTSSGAGGGTKRLAGESCDAIALASAVVIALSIDPNASLDSEPAPPDEPRPAPPPKPRKRRPPPRPAPPPRETKPFLFGSVGVLFHLLPQPSAFTSFGVGVRHRRFSVELGGAVYQPRDVRRDDKPRLGAELRLTTGELLGCYAALPFSLGALELCPGLRIEYLNASAFGASNPDNASVLIGSGVGVLRGRLRATSWLSATLDAGGALRPFHPTFVLLGVGDVYEIPKFSGFARTGLVLEF
jgi:hypothetical protein